MPHILHQLGSSGEYSPGLSWTKKSEVSPLLTPEMLFQVGWVVMVDESLDGASDNILASRSSRTTCYHLDILNMLCVRL